MSRSRNSIWAVWFDPILLSIWCRKSMWWDSRYKNKPPDYRLKRWIIVGTPIME